MTQSLIEQANNVTRPQAWLRSSYWDIIFIVSPAFLSSAFALIFREQFEVSRSIPLWAWVVFVLLIDVAHVYATLFRTYFDREAFAKNSNLLIAAPIACWALGAMLYSMSALLFWRVLAYLAVFHFIRQQYGFVALYSRMDPPAVRKYRGIDEALIYLSTLYPLLFWHTNLPRNFSWFIEGDFVQSCPMLLAQICLVVYAIVALIYFVKELIFAKTEGVLNLPKNLMIVGTALSWWVAIVAIDSDMSFTMVNVVSHGVPYMALIWLYQGRRQSNFIDALSMQNGPMEVKSNSENLAFQNKFDFVVKQIMSFAPAFVLFLFFLAYMEEGLWAGLVWREHLSVFRPFVDLPLVRDGSLLALLVPLLSLPQSTHYVLDGFIWRVKDRSSVWSA